MIWLTEIKKRDPLSGELKTWCGPRIEADTWEEAKWTVRRIKNCKILGVLICDFEYEPMYEPCQN
jgi:hypothetical protein